MATLQACQIGCFFGRGFRFFPVDFWCVRDALVEATLLLCLGFVESTGDIFVSFLSLLQIQVVAAYATLGTVRRTKGQNSSSRLGVVMAIQLNSRGPCRDLGADHPCQGLQPVPRLSKGWTTVDGGPWGPPAPGGPGGPQTFQWIIFYETDPIAIVPSQPGNGRTRTGGGCEMTTSFSGVLGVGRHQNSTWMNKCMNTCEYRCRHNW